MSCHLYTKEYTMPCIGESAALHSHSISLTLPRSQVEPELFSCLRKYGLSFYAYNPRAYLEKLIAYCSELTKAFHDSWRWLLYWPLPLDAGQARSRFSF